MEVYKTRWGIERVKRWEDRKRESFGRKKLQPWGERDGGREKG